MEASLPSIHPHDGGTLQPTIGPAERREAEQVLALQLLCYQSEAALYDDWTIPPLTQTLFDLIQEYDTHRILVARLGDEVVGSVRGRLRDQTCHVGRLIVHPRLQRRGLGGRLLGTIECVFSEATRCELFTGDRSEHNLRLYLRHGYRECRREVVSPRLSLVYLDKVLPAS